MPTAKKPVSRVADSLSTKKINTALKAMTTLMSEAMDQALEDIKLPPVQLPVFRGDELVTTIPGYVNPQLHKIIAVAEQGIPVCLFGGSGVGKTTIAEQLSAALGLPFFCQTVTAGMSESALLGRHIFNAEGGMTYANTPFLDAVETGGVFLLDEFDAIDENCALAINNLLEFGQLDLPMRTEKPRVQAHPEFRFIACANTPLTGASLIHNGRNQLDGATISRFDGGIFEIGYDPALEKQLCPRPHIRNMFLVARDAVIRHGLRKEISTRTLKRAEILWKTGVWKTPEELLYHFLRNWSENEVALVKEEFESNPKIKEQMQDELMTEEERQAQTSEKTNEEGTSQAQFNQAESVLDNLSISSD